MAPTGIGHKLGGCAHLGVNRHLTHRRLGQGLPPYQVARKSMQPFGHNRHGPKIGGCAPFGGVGSPSKIMWLGPRSTTMPSFSLIHPTVWPQYTNVTDRDRETERQRDRETERQTDRQTDRLVDRQTDRTGQDRTGQRRIA